MDKKAEKLFLKALKAKDDNPIDRHFVYNHLIDLYYKLRDERQDALDKCIHYCKEDMERLPEFLDTWRKVYGDVPECPSLERLAIIYEKDEKYQEAINICNLAIKLGLEEKWEWYNKEYGKNKGYKARISRIEKKQNK